MTIKAIGPEDREPGFDLKKSPHRSADKQIWSNHRLSMVSNVELSFGTHL